MPFNTLKNLKKYTTNYWVAYIDLMDARASYQLIKTAKTSIKYAAAEERFLVAQNALKARLPEHVDLRDFIGTFSRIIQEIHVDTLNHD